MSAIARGKPLGSGKEWQDVEYGSNVVKLYCPGVRKEAAFRVAAILRRDEVRFGHIRL